MKIGEVSIEVVVVVDIVVAVVDHCCSNFGVVVVVEAVD